MRSSKEMLALIMTVAQKLPQVEAVALEGSRMNATAPKDCFQDYDVVYIVKDKTALLKDRQWIKEFGEVLICQTPEESSLFPATLGERFTFLMLFTDGNRIDLTLCPHSEIENLQKDDPFLTSLWDPQNLLGQLPVASDQAFWLKKPTNQQFNDCCNEFWWVSTYVVKGLYRKELWYASDHLYDICQKELLRLLSWQVGATTGWNQSLGKNFKYLANFLDRNTLQQLADLQDFSSFEKIWQSLLATQKLFHQKALVLATKMNFSYDEKTAEKVSNYTEEWYQKSQLS